MDPLCEQQAVFAGISPMRLKQLVELIRSGGEAKFYDWPEWARVRRYALTMDRNECQRCRYEKHRYQKAVLVHHVKHLKDRPDLALSLVDPDTGDRQLISLCRGCHEDVHPERQWRKVVWRDYVTKERWD